MNAQNNDKVNDDFLIKVSEYMDFSDIIQYPFVFVEVGTWE